MAKYIIAVCPKCQWYCKPFDGHSEPHCINCAKQASPDGQFHLETLRKKKIPVCRVIEVIPAPSENPFLRKKSKRHSPFKRVTNART